MIHVPNNFCILFYVSYVKKIQFFLNLVGEEEGVE